MSKVHEMFPGNLPLDPESTTYKENVRRILAMKPPKVEVNDQANGALYVPIPVVEELLDYLFPNGWSFRYRHTQWIANEIIADGELDIDCGGIKRTMPGSAAVMMQYKSKTNGGDGDPMNFSNKITNTLVKDYPHLTSEMIKNASKRLGNVFGRNLNRKNRDKTAYEGAVYHPDLDDLKADLEAIGNSKEEKMKYWKSLTKEVREISGVYALFADVSSQPSPAITINIPTTTNTLPL
jgi:hypothetical protein